MKISLSHVEDKNTSNVIFTLCMSEDGYVKQSLSWGEERPKERDLGYVFILL